MDKEQFSKLLLEQKEEGRSLISLLSTMHESRNDFGDGMATFGGEDLYYVPEDELDEFQNKFELWKSYVFELLRTQFEVTLRKLIEKKANDRVFPTTVSQINSHLEQAEHLVTASSTMSARVDLESRHGTPHEFVLFHLWLDFAGLVI